MQRKFFAKPFAALGKMSDIVLFPILLILLVGAASIALAAGVTTPPKAATSASAGPDIDSGVISTLAKGKQPDLIVKFRGRPDLSAASTMASGPRGRFVYETLRAHAERAQAAVRLQLEQRHARRLVNRGYTILWIDNSLGVPAADADILNTLRNASEIESIRLNEIIPAMFEPLVPANDNRGAGTADSNIARIKAPEVWALGYRGEGIVIGSIDSGVRYTHQTLVNQYRGNTGSGFDHNHSWYDPYEHSAQPRRTDPHGSHTLGTTVGNDGGNNQIGVAPGAKWIACIGFGLPGVAATTAGLLECGQFMLAPTDTDGNDADPDLRPAVVNNSWGSCGQVFDPWFEGIVDAWIAAGIVPVFSNGNNTNCGLPAPPGLDTAGTPARSGKVLGIGSTGNNDGQYAPHSNWGPTDNPSPGWPGYPDHRGFADLKPNVVAPGVHIRSAGDASDSTYLFGTGTSMSAPHVAGLVALLWQAGPCLVGDYANTGSIIMGTANEVPYATGSPSDGPGSVPNQATGWGEIDALAAVDDALIECGPHGAVTGTIAASNSGAPIVDARLRFQGPRDILVITGEDGGFDRSLPAGTYTVDIDAFGYHSISQVVTILADQTQTLDLQLDPTERHSVSGTVIDSQNGWPLHARIHVVQPGGSTHTWSNPETGGYSIALPAGHDYSLTASASVPGYAPASVDIEQLNADTVEGFSLVADNITCTAPGYAGGGGPYEDFEAGELPVSWTRTTDRPGLLGWEFGEDLGSDHFVIPPHGNYAASNDDARPINSIARQERLITPPATIGANSQLRYASAYSGGFGLQAMVEISTDGENWAAVASPVATGSVDAPQWRDEIVNLSDYAGQTLRFAFRTDDGGEWSSGWAIDDVHISPPCDKPAPGALLIGRVIDSDLGTNGLNGATITVVEGGNTVSAASADPAIGEGWYTLYAPLGEMTVIANLPFYPNLQLDIDVRASGALRLDLDFADAGNRIFRSGFDNGEGQR